MAKAQKSQSAITSTLAKGEDGSVQITFVVPRLSIAEAKSHAIDDLAKEIEIPGFRKGKAPADKVKSYVSEATVTEKALGHILPQALGEAISKYKITPAIYPKFELVSGKEGEDWQIRAVTCELPKVDLGNYKEKIAGEARAKNIWAPGKGKSKDKGLTKEAKEQEILKILLSQVQVEVPKLLIDEEANNRLSSLLERCEKLGLSLENYLSSIGKTPEGIRGEYQNQARSTITLELILNKIAEEEGTKITDAQIEKAVATAAPTAEGKSRLNTPEQRRLIFSFLARRAALDSLVNLL
jgi:FKBP-type peptidyl-prolyl cis-trans isomerase (trigger factor)